MTIHIYKTLIKFTSQSVYNTKGNIGNHYTLLFRYGFIQISRKKMFEASMITNDLYITLVC